MRIAYDKLEFATQRVALTAARRLHIPAPGLWQAIVSRGCVIAPVGVVGLQPLCTSRLNLGSWACLAVLMALLFGPGTVSADDNGPQARDAEFVIVPVDSNIDLRATAQKYLDNPDLWPIILQLNGLDSIDGLSGISELRLPTGPLSAATEALKTSLEAIQQANLAGAQLFAPVLLVNAIELHEEAVTEKKVGMYEKSISLSGESITKASTAKTRSEESRDVEAEARLLDRQGRVEGQKPVEVSWSERLLNAILSEQEKLRTLSDSTAQVVFRDASRLRLNPNSQAVIQRMRVDPLTRREEAKISLVEGDFYALLTPESERNRLEVSLQSADAKIDSGNFWVSQDEKAARFSNYEERPVEISAAGETLVLGMNEGAVVQSGQAPRQLVRLEDSIALLQPEDESVVFTNSVDLAWASSEAAQAYWAELAYDPRFDRMVKSLLNLPENKVDSLELAPGVYYWRVAVLDQFGLPGQMSTVGQFEVRSDDTAPFLRILSPRQGEVLRKNTIEVQGETEPDARISINETSVQTDPEGKFSASIEFPSGSGAVEVTSVDRAGNETVRTVEIAVLIDERNEIRFDPGLLRDRSGTFLSANDTLTLSGEVVADARIEVFDANGGARSETFTGSDGKFLLNLPLRDVLEQLEIKVTTASGYDYRENLAVQVQKGPPVLTIDPVIPSITSQPRSDVAISSSQQADITVNGQTAEFRDGFYHAAIELDEGANTVEIIAKNAFGLIGVETRSVILDTTQPELVSQVLQLGRRGKRDFMKIRIGADDASGLAKTSKVRIIGDGGEKNGVLRFNRAGKVYQGNIEAPPNGGDDGYMVVVELVDVAGNVNTLELVQ